jgi:uncharacterized protein (DUF433 family)
MRERIAVRSDSHFGKPCVEGTRITVQSVLELVREGLAPVEICRDFYPDLSTDDVRACVQLGPEFGGHSDGWGTPGNSGSEAGSE